MCKRDNVLRGYSVSGSPVISGGILYLPGSEQRVFIYTPQRFAPGSADWSIETKIRLHAFTPNYSDVLSSVGDSGERNWVFCVQGEVSTWQGSQNKAFHLFASTDNRSWNLINNGDAFGIGVLEVWRYVKLEKKSGKLAGYQKYDGTDNWITNGVYDYNYTGINTKVAFGGGFANRNTNCDIDLSETKIYIGGELWWRAI